MPFGKVFHGQRLRDFAEESLSLRRKRDPATMNPGPSGKIYEYDQVNDRLRQG